MQVKAIPQWQRFLVIRTSGDPMGILRELRRVVASIDPEEPLNHVISMTGLVERETAQSRIQTALLGGLAGLGLIMACIGIYGVMAYMVAQRKQEMGVRLALGATRLDVFALVLRKGMWLVLLGITIGVVTGLGIAQLLRGMLFEVSPSDPLVIVGVVLLLTTVALIACFIPAHRAASVDPVQALRLE